MQAKHQEVLRKKEGKGGWREGRKEGRREGRKEGRKGRRGHLDRVHAKLAQST